MKNEYEELIQPQSLSEYKNLIQKIGLVASKILKGTEKHPRKTRDGSLTYIDSYGRLVIERVEHESVKYGKNTKSLNVSTGEEKLVEETPESHSRKTIIEIYPGYTKNREPEIEEVFENKDYRNNELVGHTEERAYFKSREEYENYKRFQDEKAKMPEDIYVPPFGEGNPFAKASITYDLNGGYKMNLLDNSFKITNLGYGDIEWEGYKSSTITKAVTPDGYKVERDTSYIEKDGMKVSAKEHSTQIMQEGQILGEEASFSNNMGDKVEYRNIESLNYSRTAIDRRAGNYLDMNGVIKNAIGSQQVCFERTEDGLKRISQPTLQQMLKEYNDKDAQVANEQNSKDYSKYTKLEVDAKKRQATFTKTLKEGAYKNTIDDIKDVFNSIIKMTGIDKRFNFGVADWKPTNANANFLSPFAARGSTEGINYIEVQRLISMDEARNHQHITKVPNHHLNRNDKSQDDMDEI